MLEIYRKQYTGKIGVEITYYFNINTRGTKKHYEVIYEWLSDGGYQFSKYLVELNDNVKNSAKIENDVYRFTPILFSTVKAQRRLAVLSKFILYLISEVNNIPIYKLVQKVVYYHNGVESILSVNAFVKSTYELIPKFEKIYKEQ